MSESATFRPHERLNDPKHFQRAFARKKSVSDASLIVYAEFNGLAFSRLGISVGKKRVKTAVARNKLKRVIREAFRLNKATIPLGIDLVVVPRGPAVRFETAMISLPHLAQSAFRRLPKPSTAPVS